MEGTGMFAFLVGAVVGILIWFFLNRASVRANRQVELLESIERHLAAMSGRESMDVKSSLSASGKSANDFLEEARKNAGL